MRSRLDNMEEVSPSLDTMHRVYKRLSVKWKENPTWESLLVLYKEVYSKTEEQAAKDLAWLGFFADYVIPHLQKKGKDGEDL